MYPVNCIRGNTHLRFVHLNFGHHANLRTREIKESAVLLFYLCFTSKVRNFVVKRKTTAL